MTGSRRHPNVGDPQNVFDEILARRLSRRSMLKGSLGLAAMSLFGGCQSLRDAQDTGPRLGFTSIPPSKADAVIVAPEYEWHVVNAWGDPIMPGAPDFKPDASQSAAEQAMQAGMFHDGMTIFRCRRGRAPPPTGSSRSTSSTPTTTCCRRTAWRRGRREGPEIEERARPGRVRGAVRRRTWRTVKDSPYGRRITADTPFALRGPAAGHAWMRTAADPEGRTVLGTFNNCANGTRPWGTYLSCEENFTAYFVNDSGRIPRLQDRYGIPPTKDSWGFRWHEFDERFDAVQAS